MLKYCLWSTDKDYRKLFLNLNLVNSVSGLAIDFVYSLPLDFSLDHMRLINCWGSRAFLSK